MRVAFVGFVVGAVMGWLLAMLWPSPTSVPNPESRVAASSSGEPRGRPHRPVGPVSVDRGDDLERREEIKREIAAIRELSSLFVVDPIPWEEVAPFAQPDQVMESTLAVLGDDESIRDVQCDEYPCVVLTEQSSADGLQDRMRERLEGFSAELEGFGVVDHSQDGRYIVAFSVIDAELGSRDPFIRSRLATALAISGVIPHRFEPVTADSHEASRPVVAVPRPRDPPYPRSDGSR